MNPAAAQAETDPAPIKPRSTGLAGAALPALFVVMGAATLANQSGQVWPMQPWLNAAFVAATLLASIAALAPPLAWPNVLLAGGLAAFIGSLAHAVNAATGLPFGQLEFTAAAGPLLLGLIPWWLPVAWAVIALTARGTARLVLARWRSQPRHGYHVIALATGLALVSTMTLHHYATGSARFWQAPSTPLPGLATALFLHLLTQIGITALLIDKFPGAHSRNFRPLLVWAGSNILLIAGSLLE